jgi:hypothetical protein
MSATTARGTDPLEAPTVSSRWRLWQVVLLACLGVIVVTTLLTGTRPASLGELQHELAGGEVSAVTLLGELPPDATGQTQVEILWHDGLLRRYTTVQQTRGAVDDGQLSDGVPDVSLDLARELTALTPTGQLDVVSEPFRTVCPTSVYGWCGPGALALPMMAWSMLVLATLVGGPEPRMATRWAWFWLLCGFGPVVLLAYLLVGLPRPGAPLRPQGRRLTGGWAFLVSVVLGGQAS